MLKWFTLSDADPGFELVAPYRLEAKLTIDAAPDRIWRALIDVGGWRQWFPHFRSGRWTSAQPHGVGSTREMRILAFGVRERFTVWEKGERVVFSVTALTVPVATRMMAVYTLTPLDEERTRTRWVLYYDVRPLLEPLHRVARPFIERTFRQAASGLQAHLSQGRS